MGKQVKKSSLWATDKKLQSINDLPIEFKNQKKLFIDGLL